jgi:hypothetical protein
MEAVPDGRSQALLEVENLRPHDARLPWAWSDALEAARRARQRATLDRLRLA